MTKGDGDRLTRAVRPVAAGRTLTPSGTGRAVFVLVLEELG